VPAAIVVAIAIIVLVQLEAHLLQPLIMSRSVEVHPLAIAISVLTGTLLLGIVGALLAVPLVAFLNTTIHALRDSGALEAVEAEESVEAEATEEGDADRSADV
jgi:predicted PurR-regulated permease PerM